MKKIQTAAFTRQEKRRRKMANNPSKGRGKNLQDDGYDGTPVDINVLPEDPSQAIGLPQQFTAQGVDANGKKGGAPNVSWNSSDTTVATIDSNGLATCLIAGSTT